MSRKAFGFVFAGAAVLILIAAAALILHPQKTEAIVASSSPSRDEPVQAPQPQKPEWIISTGRAEQDIDGAKLVFNCRQGDQDIAVTIYPSGDLSRKVEGDYAAYQTPVIVRLDHQHPHWNFWRYRPSTTGHENAEGSSWVEGDPAMIFTTLKPDSLTVGSGSLDPLVFSSQIFYVAIDPSDSDTENVDSREPSVGYLQFDVSDLPRGLTQAGCPLKQILGSEHSKEEDHESSAEGNKPPTDENN